MLPAVERMNSRHSSRVIFRFGIRVPGGSGRPLPAAADSTVTFTSEFANSGGTITESSHLDQPGMSS